MEITHIRVMYLGLGYATHSSLALLLAARQPLSPSGQTCLVRIHVRTSNSYAGDERLILLHVSNVRRYDGHIGDKGPFNATFSLLAHTSQSVNNKIKHVFCTLSDTSRVAHVTYPFAFGERP